MSEQGSAKWWILGGVVALGAVIAGLALGGGDPPDPTRVGATPGEAGVSARDDGDGPGAPGAERRDLGAAARAPRFGGDGGVAPAPGLPRRAEVAPRPTGVQGALLRRQNLPDEADRTAGWRLGRTRRRASVLQDRITRLEENVERLRAQGQADLAERQASVIGRTRTRLGELREEERELAAQAAADGTSGDAEAGFESELPGMGRPTAQGALPRE